MDGTAVTAIRDLAQTAAGPDTVIEAGGELFSTVGLQRLPKEHKPDEPDTLILNSLQGLVDYIEQNRDQLVGAESIIHVSGPTRVRVISRLQERAVRLAFVEARAQDLASGFVGQRMDLLTANIGLQSRFVDAHDRAMVLRVIGNVKDEGELRVQDDGRTQTVKTRAGIALADETEVPNPVTLAPFRTFREVEQPESAFVLRLDKGAAGPTFALYEADGGAWHIAAVERIAAWLDGKVGDFAIIR